MLSVTNFCPLLGGIVKIGCLYFLYTRGRSFNRASLDVVMFMVKKSKGSGVINSVSFINAPSKGQTARDECRIRKQ
jgi:hypothetical protein